MSATDHRFTVGSLIESQPCCAPVVHLSLQGVSVHYGTRTVLDAVSLDIPRGCITALIGPSGCGKTSLLSTLNRLTDLLPDCRVGGRILLDGTDIREHDALTLRRRVGMIFQRPNPFPLSIRRNLDLPLREHGVRDASERAERIEQALPPLRGHHDEVGGLTVRRRQNLIDDDSH